MAPQIAGILYYPDKLEKDFLKSRAVIKQLITVICESFPL